MKKLIFALVLAAGLAFAQTDVTVTHMTGNRADDVDFLRTVADEYMANNPHTIGGEEYNVTIEILAGPESATDRFGLYLQFFQTQSDEVDVFDIDVIWPGDLSEHLVDLNQFPELAELSEQHFAAIVENNTVNGALVGMPYFTDAGLLYYRQDLLDKYGFDGPPTTWSELESMAQTIQDGERAAGNPDFWGFTWQGNAYEGLTCDALEWVNSSNGGQIIEPDGTITINNENAINALETAASWVGTISPPGITGFQEEDARNMWQAGNAAFMRNWPYAYSLGQADDSDIAGLFDVTTLPAADAAGAAPAATLGGWQLAVSKYATNTEVSADWVRYMTTYDMQLRTALERSLLPTVEAVYEAPELLASNVAWFNNLLPVFQNAKVRVGPLPGGGVHGDGARLQRDLAPLLHRRALRAHR